MYVLITAARDEEAYIEDLLSSVMAQTLQPLRWLIMSDGSTDRTDEIVRGYAAECPFIELVRVTPDEHRSFGSKARAINEAHRRLQDMTWEYLGILDADVSFESNYYEQLLPKFEKDPRLGIGGGYVMDTSRNGFKGHTMSVNWSVRGPVQMFRRACFQDIGGYLPLPHGGIDCVAEIMARMHGWNVRTFPELTAFHHRTTGTETQGYMRARFKLGLQNYATGYHPLFMLARTFARVAERPYMAGAAALLAGYVSGALRREPRQVPPDVVRFLRREQMKRLFGRARTR